MRIVTSIGPNRIERQQLCINSWLGIGCSVTSVQSEGEAELFQPLFPDVEFTETDLIGNVFRKPKLVRIHALTQQATSGPVLILNSDIEVRSTKDEFYSRWSTPAPNVLKLGIRWDENPTTKALTLLKWGIDAFLITPKIAGRLQDIGMTMGCPAWDYWIPIFLYEMCNYSIVTHKHPELIHEDHPKNWSGTDYRIGVSLLKKHTGLSERESSMLIRKLTVR
jgi:hypothetical protein